MLLGHVTHPARCCLHRTVLEGVVKDVLLHAGMGVRGGREGGKQRGREGTIRRQEEVTDRERSGGGEAVMLPVSARPPGWHGRWQQLRLLQGLADRVVQS